MSSLSNQDPLSPLSASSKYSRLDEDEVVSSSRRGRSVIPVEEEQRKVDFDFEARVEARGQALDEIKAAKPPACPVKMAVFTVNLIAGLFLSQLIPSALDPAAAHVWAEVVAILTMFCLSYIMVNVGYEFDIDKTKLRSYGVDYLVAMTAAGFPWVFCALWFMYALPSPMELAPALLAARFAAPTSAGILFSMLEAAGMKDTWVFQKARILAIFDDLDTILLMIPLKVLVVGMRWELSIDLVLCFGLLGVAYKWLHVVKLPCSWGWTLVYAGLVTAFCEMLHFTTYSIHAMDAVHLEVLLPAFCLGCIARAGHSTHTTMSRSASMVEERKVLVTEERVSDGISAAFMVLVGLSMPSLFSLEAGSHRRLAAEAPLGVTTEYESLEAGPLVGHVLAVSALMVLGKLFPLVCYRQEATWKTRLALSLGMCPRGEVGAGVIVISLSFGVGGPAIAVAVMALALNLICSSAFIMAVKALAEEPSTQYDPEQSPYDPDHTTAGSSPNPTATPVDDSTPERWPSKGSVASVGSVASELKTAAIAPKEKVAAAIAPVVCICLAILAFNAGFVNVVCGVGSWGHYVTHVTGAISTAAVQPAEAVLTLFQVLGFALGAGVSGLLVSSRRVAFGRGRYGLALLLNAAALLFAWALVELSPSAAVLAAAVASGLQNGMGMCFSGAVVRTTHMTGVVTDIGVITAKLLRFQCATSSALCGGAVSPYAARKEAAKDWWNLKLLLALAVSFAVGSCLGAQAVAALGDDALLLSVALTGALGAAYLYFRVCVLQQTLAGESIAAQDAEPKVDAAEDILAEQFITLEDVEGAIREWERSAGARDVDGTTALYDPSGGRLLGTIDEASDIRRNTPDAIRAYFVNFLGGHEEVTPNFPDFDAEDVIFLGNDVASYSGYYHFALVKDGLRKKVHAKFTYIFRKTKDGVRIMTHNSGITPKGVVSDHAGTKRSTERRGSV